MNEKEENVDGDRLAAGKLFYIKIGVWNQDGTMSTQAEGMFAHKDIQPVIDNCLEDAMEHGTENYVYECRAVRRVYQPEAKVVVLKVKK